MKTQGEKVFRKGAFFICLTFVVSSCGYHFSQSSSDSDLTYSISVPYIQGDPDAYLNNELASQLANSGRFHCVQSGGDFTLQVVLLSDTNERIGYRYDRDDVTGKRKSNILGIENRRNIIAEVTLFNASTSEVVYGPAKIKAWADYDYVDSGSPRDLNTFIAPGKTEPTIRFSLGQLDTVEGAHDDASLPAYRHLARQVVQSLLNKTQHLSE